MTVNAGTLLLLKLMPIIFSYRAFLIIPSIYLHQWTKWKSIPSSWFGNRKRVQVFGGEASEGEHGVL